MFDHRMFRDVYKRQLVYSGNFRMQAEVDTHDVTRITAGINPEGFDWKLEPGESFQTPEAVQMCIRDSIFPYDFQPIHPNMTFQGKHLNTCVLCLFQCNAKFGMHCRCLLYTSSIEEAADYTGIGRNTLRKLVEWKKLPVLKVGRKVLIKTDILLVFGIVQTGYTVKSTEYRLFISLFLTVHHE